jgi:hypothetical protein
MFKLVISILILTVLMGCGRRRADPAEVALMQTLNSIHRNQMDVLLTQITPHSREVLVRAVQLDEKAGGGRAASQITSRLGWQFERPVVGRARVVEGAGSDEKRVVEMEFGGQKMRFPVLRLGHGWQVDLVKAEIVSADVTN